MLEVMVELDGNILLFIQEVIRNPVLTSVFQFITTLGNVGMIWILISILLLFRKSTRKIGYMGLLALVASVLVNNMLLKNIVERPRPYDIIEGLQPLIRRPKDFSFPSGHTGSSFAAATVLYRNLPKQFGIWTILLAVFIGLSRLYLGVHYPTDVLAGMLLGIALGYGAERLVNWLGEKRK